MDILIHAYIPTLHLVVRVCMCVCVCVVCVCVCVCVDILIHTYTHTLPLVLRVCVLCVCVCVHGGGVVRSVRVNIGLDRDRADKSVKLFLVVK